MVATLGKEEFFINNYCFLLECPSPDENGILFLAPLARKRYSGQREIAPENYSDFKIIGKTNWVFTLIPRFIAGSTAGKSLSLDCKTLSTVTMS